MFKNYFKVAYRNLFRHKAFSFINIMGLAISMSICLLIILMIKDQYSSDRWHSQKDQIYRIVSQRSQSGRLSDKFASSPLPLARAMQEQIPGVKHTVRFRTGMSGDVTLNGKEIPAHGHFVDNSLFEVFDFELEYGDASTALLEPYSVVLTRKLADKFSLEGNPVGQIMEVKGIGTFTVTGILKADMGKTHFNFGLLGSASSMEALEEAGILNNVVNNWESIYVNYVYLLLEPGTEVAAVHEQLNQLSAENYLDPDRVMVHFSLQALTNINPGPEMSNQIGFAVPIAVVYFLSMLALVVMLSACFNYTSLSLARALKRSKEIGIRKVAGASRGQIFTQFISEAILMSFVALLMAVVMLEFLIPAFYNLEPEVSRIFQLKADALTYVIFVLFSLFIGGLAGFLPAFYLARFDPVKVLKRMGSHRLFSRMTLRKGLIVLQFALSLIFIVSTLSIYYQLKFVLNKDLGFETENIVNIELQGNDVERIKKEIASHPDVRMISASNVLPSTGSSYSGVIRKPGALDSMYFNHISADRQYIDNMKLSLVAGGNFPEGISAENSHFILLNEAAVKRLELGEPVDALGKLVIYDGMEVEIVGVLKDFHFQKLSREIGPMVLRYVPRNFAYLNVSLVSTDIPTTMKELEARWEKLDQVHEFSFGFFDEQIAHAYTELLILTKIIGFVGGLAILIACLGLLGMAIYSTETRIKEIGIRKILGADVSQLVLLLSRGFLILIGIATVIALPLAWFINNLWLQEYVYHIDLGIGILGSGVVLLLVLGIGIIIPQVLKAANANPVEALRSE